MLPRRLITKFDHRSIGIKQHVSVVEQTNSASLAQPRTITIALLTRVQQLLHNARLFDHTVHTLFRSNDNQ